MERETITFTTPISKQEIVAKAYVTGREKRAIRDIFLNEKMTDSEKFNKAQDMSFSTVIVSVDNSTENVVEKVLDLRSEDFNFVVEKVNSVTSDEKFEEKKTA